MLKLIDNKLYNLDTANKQLTEFLMLFSNEPTYTKKYNPNSNKDEIIISVEDEFYTIACTDVFKRILKKFGCDYIYIRCDYIYEDERNH